MVRHILAYRRLLRTSLCLAAIAIGCKPKGAASNLDALVGSDAGASTALTIIPMSIVAKDPGKTTTNGTAASQDCGVR